jgi:hypothetical protein
MTAIRLEHGLAYVEAVVTFRGRNLRLSHTILDTGSASTIFAADRMLEIGVAPEAADPVRRIRVSEEPSSSSPRTWTACR